MYAPASRLVGKPLPLFPGLAVQQAPSGCVTLASQTANAGRLSAKPLKRFGAPIVAFCLAHWAPQNVTAAPMEFAAMEKPVGAKSVTDIGADEAS